MLGILSAVGVAALLVAATAMARPGWLAGLPPLVVGPAAAVGMAALVTSSAAPTGWEPLDLVLRAVLGALVPVAAAWSPPGRSAWLVGVAAATVLVADAPLEPVAAAAAGALGALWIVGEASPPARAVLVAMALVPLGHLDWALSAGAAPVAVAVAVLPALAGAVGGVQGSARRVVLAGLGVLVAVGLVGGLAGVVAALSARGDLDRAVAAATEGLDRIGDDDDAAARELEEAAAAFSGAKATLTAWWARPALLVPGVAQQSRAVSTMAGAGADLSRTAISALAEADTDRVRPRDGVVDLVALEELSEPLDRSLASLRRADARLAKVDSPVLVTPVADRLADLRERLDGALGSAEVAARAVEVAPGLLGADGPRRYFIAVQTPAEIRGSGGFMGSWAEMVVDGGRFELVRTGRVRDLTQGGPDPAGRRIEGEDEFVERYGQLPAQFWGLIGFSPDFPTVGRIMAQLFPQSGGTEIDGVIGITPRAFAALLEITGSIEVADYPEPFTAQSAERILLHEQYLVFPEEIRAERVEFLGEVTEVLFDELMTGELPGPSSLAASLGPVVESRDLQLWARRPAEQALFEVIGADGSAARGEADGFGIISQNAGGNKIDYFLHRDVRYAATWDPGSGEVRAEITARFRNEAPSEGLPRIVIGPGGDAALGQPVIEWGHNLMLVTVYSTFPVRSVALDGRPVGFVAGRELGFRTAQLYVEVPPGGSVELRAEVSGGAVAGDRYAVRALRQATVHPDELGVELTVAPGWVLDAGGGVAVDGSRAVGSWRSDEDRTVRVVARPSGPRSVLDRLRGAR